MSPIVKLAAAALALVLTAAVVGGVAYGRGRDDRQRSARYELDLASAASLVAPGVRRLTVQAQSPRYRVRLAPDTVVEVAPGPSCHYVTWRTVRESEGR